MIPARQAPAADRPQFHEAPIAIGSPPVNATVPAVPDEDVSAKPALTNAPPFTAAQEARIRAMIAENDTRWLEAGLRGVAL